MLNCDDDGDRFAVDPIVPLVNSVLLTVDFLLWREDYQAAVCRGCSRA